MTSEGDVRRAAAEIWNRPHGLPTEPAPRLPSRWDAFTEDELWDLLYALENADPQHGADDHYLARSHALIEDLTAETARRPGEPQPHWMTDVIDDPRTLPGVVSVESTDRGSAISRKNPFTSVQEILIWPMRDITLEVTEDTTWHTNPNIKQAVADRIPRCRVLTVKNTQRT